VFERACSLIDAVLRGDVRRRLVAEWCPPSIPPSRALRRVRDALAGNLRECGADYATLDGHVREYDTRTRRDGFHVLHDWDGTAGRVTAQTVPVDVAAFAIDRRGDEPGHDVAAAILLDYHYLTLLALLSLRIWDEGDPDANLDRLDGLLAVLHGEGGSGHRVASRAATLILVATAHYEPDERGYGALLEKVQSLDRRHRVSIALDHAVAMGCHLRFGLEASYGRDVGVMREDNLADYPWLRFAVLTLLDEDADGRDDIAEGLMNGLCPDPSVFLADPEFRERFDPRRTALLDAFERFRPNERAYSPLSFFFNFSHNVVKGLVVDAVLRGRPWNVTLNDLLTTLPASGLSRKIDAATTLMAHSRRSPACIRGRLTPAIVYDPATGRHGFAHALRRLKE
jgi:hypothetical protein